MFNRSQIQALALLHTMLGAVILALLLVIQEPVAEWVFIPVIGVYLEYKTWQEVRRLV